MKIFDGLYSFFESLGEYVKNFSNLFWIFLGAFLLVSVIIIIITTFAYECKLTKTIDKINKFLERNPRINDDNLVAFNNLMKARSVPKTLRRQWQQFMLYREHPASYYMSFKHCVENPLRNSTYRQQMTIYKVISYVLIALSFMVSLFMTADSFNANRIFKEVLLIPATILVLYWLISMVLDLVHSAVSGDLFQNYQYFEINMDKAMLTLPEFVDYEVLFSQEEIRRGIPVLFAYLQKRAIQEQQELERARLKSVDHEKFDFDKAGLDGSLVLDRAMRETENYTTQRKKYMQEIERINNEISVLENNYKEQTKEFQRQVQTSKETVENLKEQLEQASSTIEINYIKKQMRDEINRQQLSEKDFDILTDKHNQEIKTLNQEIKHYEEEIKKAKEAMEVAMLSEFNTYSIKVYDNLEKIVDEKMQDRVDDYKDQIKGLEVELEDKNEELENVYTRYQEALAQIPIEAEPVVQEVVEEMPTKKKKKKKSSRDEQPADEGLVQPEQVDQYDQGQQYMPYDDQGNYAQYDNQGYIEGQDYMADNQDYVLNDQAYVDNNGVYDENQNYVYAEQVNNDGIYDDYVPMDDNQGEYVPLDDNYTQDTQYVPVQDEYNQENYDNNLNQGDYIPVQDEYVPMQEENIQTNEEYVPLNDYSQEGFVNGEYVPLDSEYNPNDDTTTTNIEVSQEPVEELKTDETNAEEFDDSDFDIDFNQDSNTNQDFGNMDFDFDFGGDVKTEEISKVEPQLDVVDDEDEGEFDLNQALGIYNEVPSTQQAEPETQLESEEKVDEENKESQPTDTIEEVVPVKRKAGRPRKVVDENEVVEKRKVGRPKKVVEQEEDKPKRKAGRPRKEVDETVAKKPGKRGRPKKVVEGEATETPKVKAGRGRPRKVVDENQTEQPKRKAGRPKKEVDETVAKKPGKRGRPKKQVSAEDSVVNEEGVLGKPKRKAGRPKKTN